MPLLVWPTSFKLTPHQLQQTQRGRAERLAARLAMCGVGAPGVVRLAIDYAALADGAFRVRSLEAVMPSGEIVACEGTTTPPPLRIASAFRASTLGVDVSIALRRADARGPNSATADSQTALRHRAGLLRASDTQAGESVTEICTAEPRAVLMLEGDPDEGAYERLFLARVVRSGVGFAIDPDRPAQLANVHASDALRAALVELFERLVRRTRELEETIRWDPRRPERFDPTDTPALVLASTLARFQPLLSDVLARDIVPPIELHRVLVRFVGALRAVSAIDDVSSPPAFDDAQPGQALVKRIREAQDAISVELWSPFHAHAFEHAGAGTRVAVLPTKASDASFFLAARGVDPTALVQMLSTVAKFASPATVDRITGTATSGIGVAPDLSPPSTLPSSRGLTFFRFDVSSPLWAEARAAGRLAVRVPSSAADVALRIYVLNESA